MRDIQKGLNSIWNKLAGTNWEGCQSAVVFAPHYTTPIRLFRNNCRDNQRGRRYLISTIGTVAIKIMKTNAILASPIHV
jgi:hypothetical protein